MIRVNYFTQSRRRRQLDLRVGDLLTRLPGSWSSAIRARTGPGRWMALDSRLAVHYGAWLGCSGYLQPSGGACVSFRTIFGYVTMERPHDVDC
jgi:hypothetical protein